jgi:hypothetical protein
MPLNEPTAEDRQVGGDLTLEINARGGIPLSLAAYLLRAVGAAYPNTQIKNGGGYGPTLQLLIARDDLYEATDVTDEDLASLGGEKDIAEMAAFTSGWRDGALGLGPPAWLSSLLQVTAEQMVDAMPPAAENYVAIEINCPGRDPFVWIVSRPGRPSPHDLRRQAEAERDAARTQLAELLPYARAGADALDVREPYGLTGTTDEERAAHDVLCDAASDVLARIKDGEFGS